jgi:hypothetical protein
VLHAVEPWRRAGAFRYACSFWFRSAAAGAPAPAPPRTFASHDAAATWFAASPRLREVAPFVYDAAIARAARAAAAGAPRAALLRSHAAARDAALRKFGAPLLAGLDARRAAVDARGCLGSDDDGDDGDDAPWEREPKMKTATSADSPDWFQTTATRAWKTGKYAAQKHRAVVSRNQVLLEPLQQSLGADSWCFRDTFNWNSARNSQPVGR